MSDRKSSSDSDAGLDRHELGSWLRLLQTPSIGRASARQLLASFGSAEAIFDASYGALKDAAGAARADALSAPVTPAIESSLDATLAWLAASVDYRRCIVTVGDPLYPRLLLETADPPLLLFAQGRVELMGQPAVAMVGSRNPTPQGLENAKAFAVHLSGCGVTVVSGLALGIDGAAHEGALEGAAGTIAVVGTGLDTVYPRRHLDLARRISSAGLMVSEFPLATPPLAAHFPQRNRIIAGLSLGTLVVEAAVQSGSLITARMALESGREVFAIPGSIHSPQSRGCNHLIKQGAKLVDRAEDVLEELQLEREASQKHMPPAHADKADPVVEALGFDPMTLDELVSRTGWSAQQLNTKLLELEIAGRVSRLPGQRFQRLILA